MTDDEKRDAAFEEFWQNTALPQINNNFLTARWADKIRVAAQADWNEAWKQCKISNNIQ